MKMDEEADNTRKLDEHLAAEVWEVPKQELYEMVACAATRMHALLNSGENLEQAIIYQDFIRQAMETDVKDMYDAMKAEEKKAEEEAIPGFPNEEANDGEATEGGSEGSKDDDEVVETHVRSLGGVLPCPPCGSSQRRRSSCTNISSGSSSGRRLGSKSPGGQFLAISPSAAAAAQ